ncbi:hypothetical protein SAMN05660653_02456 [Desulfonatronum thiosulfatophilum]|uniref:Uncharacterized protein n=1 Tax=Desulfonatronum thiosulfatophilum TaxID=617002 RepID=A0A1G6DXM8_9BACT|nr:hypothetical protein SAMN05660653_02456 [Desulfonatronum thiosulfatophilum]
MHDFTLTLLYWTVYLSPQSFASAITLDAEVTSVKIIPILSLVLLLSFSPVMAQQPLTSPERSPANSSNLDAAIDALHSDIDVLQRNPSPSMLDILALSTKLAELEKLSAPMTVNSIPAPETTSHETRDFLTIGAGAGLGFLASGLVMTGVLGPMTHSLATGVGLSWMTARLLSASVTTLGVVSGTYAGGMYARNLVVD